jgi:copper chaperone
MKNSFVIENLKCGGCASSIRNGLIALPGITDVEVDFETNTVTVEAEQDDIRPLVADTLSSMGYPEAGHNTLLKQGKSYISCAIGRIKG